MSIVLQSTGGGSVTIAEPSTASNVTVTIPAATGDVMVSGNMPAFSAYRTGGNQSVTTNTWTKVQLNAEDFDTASAFDSTTNYRFTPLVAGYYLINACVASGSSSYTTTAQCGIYKNGSLYRVGTMSYSSEIINFGGPAISAVIYFNGSTDYVELYGLIQASSGPQISGSTNSVTFMSGALIRTA
jgi:hypothetical protein